MDSFTQAKRSEIMRKIKSTNSKMEVLFNKKLAELNYKYQKNVKNTFGNPDVVFKRKKVVIFLDSCFWHGCKKHLRLPKSNQTYWFKKIKNNVIRDKQITKYYRNNGWKILRFWEHQLKKDFDKQIYKVAKTLGI